MKYSRHPQKFDCKDPELQRQWEDLKEVLCDNEHMKYYKIMVGQKINLKTIFNVWTTPSNDLSNIWSHFLFGIFFIVRAFNFEGRFFWLNAITAYTYFMSSMYHTFRTYSRKLYNIFLVFDVLGIAIQISTYNIVDTISLMGTKRPDLEKLYLIVYISILVLNFISIPIILHYKKYTVRTILFCVVATSGFVLMYNGYLVNGVSEEFKALFYNRLITFAYQGVGIFFRGSHIPERWLPNTIWQEYFHSHFWFHIVASIGSIYACRSSEALINFK